VGYILVDPAMKYSPQAARASEDIVAPTFIMLAHREVDTTPVRVEKRSGLADGVIDREIQSAVKVLRPSAFPHASHHALADFVAQVERPVAARAVHKRTSRLCDPHILTS
jgi:hypothetical protein